MGKDHYIRNDGYKFSDIKYSAYQNLSTYQWKIERRIDWLKQ